MGNESGPMRILYHHRTLGDGAEGIHIREMVRAFRALGHEVRVIGPAGEAAPQPTGKSRRLSALKRAVPGALFELLEIAYSVYAFVQTLREIFRFKPSFIYDRYITFNAGVVLAGKLANVPVLLEVNAPLALERSAEQDERLFWRRVAKAMERWTCTHAARTIVVSTPLKEYLESIGVPTGQCFVMPNGVDPQRFVPRAGDALLRARVDIPEEAFVVGFTGVLRPWHGLDLLLTAASGLVRQGLNIYVLIVGDGPYRVSMEEMARSAGIGDRLRVTGRVPHADVPNYVALFDVAVSPRATFYASPMKVIEYMALGKPVVTPDTQNFLDILDHNRSGVTFRDGQPQALEQVLAALYGSADTCRDLGAQARQKVEARLNWRWNAIRSCQLAQLPLIVGSSA